MARRVQVPPALVSWVILPAFLAAGALLLSACAGAVARTTADDAIDSTDAPRTAATPAPAATPGDDPAAPMDEGAARGSLPSPRELVPLLTRSGVGPDLRLIDITYAPPVFFEATGIPVPFELGDRPTLAFFLQETVHDGDLPLEVPESFLLLPGGARIAPYDARVTADDSHHRTSRLLFPQPGDWPGALVDEGGAPVLRLIVPRRDGTFSVANTFEWSIPVEVGGPATADG